MPRKAPSRTSLKTRLLACHYDNLDIAGLYERHGNAKCAMQLRAASNLLWSIFDGSDCGTVCPKTDLPFVMCKKCSKSYIGVDRASEDETGKTINMCPMCKALDWRKRNRK